MNNADDTSTVGVLTAIAVAVIWLLYTRRTPFRWTQRADPMAELFVNAALGIVLGAILATVVIGEYAFAGLFCISALSILAITWAKNQDDLG